MTRITDILHEHKCTFFIIYCSMLLEMRNDAHKTCREYSKQKISFFNCTVY
jgi:hypothetical protein